MTGNEAELQKTTAPSLLIAVLIPKELKGDRHKYKGQVMPTIKSRFPSYVACRINGKPGMPTEGRE